jgi:hypothetical protein
MTRLIGRLLIAIAVGHAIVGVILFRAPLAAILQDGLFDAVAPHVLRDGVAPYFDRLAAFWFLVMSPVLGMVARIAERAAVRRDGETLAIVGWNLLAIGTAGVIAMPASGFWTLIAIAPLLLSAGRRVTP